MDAIDGVSKVFMLKHEYGGTLFMGAKNERELVERLLHRLDGNTAENHIEWLTSLKAKVDEVILLIKQDYEIYDVDGHLAR